MPGQGSFLTLWQIVRKGHWKLLKGSLGLGLLGHGRPGASVV